MGGKKLSGSSLNATSEFLTQKYIPGKDVKRAAQRTICAFASDSREAGELMRMLGVHPDQNEEEFHETRDS
jgi:hypothetical protein